MSSLFLAGEIARLCNLGQPFSDEWSQFIFVLSLLHPLLETQLQVHTPLAHMRDIYYARSLVCM